MASDSANIPTIPPLRQGWRDWSLRTKLLLFAVGLVTVPGGLFAMFAFSGVRAGLEREVAIQLRQTAERGADAIASALERARGDARSWASQDVMRDLAVGDIDKRVSRFLRTVREGKAEYIEVLCADPQGEVVAASSGEWLGKNIAQRPAIAASGGGAESLVGPAAWPGVERRVLEIGVPIRSPDPPGDQIGSLVLIYDWNGVTALLERIRFKLAEVGKGVTALVVDAGGEVIGSASSGDAGPVHTALLADRWTSAIASGYGKHQVAAPDGLPVDLLVGAATIPDAGIAGSVLFVEPLRDALAPVDAVRRQWIVLIATISLVGLVAAALLARQVMRPLDEVTRATTDIASNPERDLPLLPVRSGDEVGQLAESFNKMTVELKRSQEETLAAAKFAFAGELAAMVAHEVRTPLSVMRSSAQMLASPASAPSEDNAELVETIVAEVDRVERVVTGLIQLARPVEQRPEATQLGDLLSRAADFVAAQAARQQIHIVRDLDEDETPALCDPEQIYQVVLNLVVNALQVLPAGGTIRLRTLPAVSGAVGFEIGDDGPGLPVELRDRIFQPFVTGRDGGTGLGLAFVDRIVKAHRGTVAVRSEAGGGTVFEVKLPTVEPKA